MISSVWPLEFLVLSTWWIYLSVEIQFFCSWPCSISDGTHGYCANQVRHDKLLTAFEFDGAISLSYVLIVVWPHCELYEAVQLKLKKFLINTSSDRTLTNMIFDTFCSPFSSRDNRLPDFSRLNILRINRCVLKSSILLSFLFKIVTIWDL